MNYRIEQLEKQVEKHNNVVERMYQAEGHIEELQHDVQDTKKEFKEEPHMKAKFKIWIKAAGIRAIKTVAQTAVATIGTAAILSEVNWIAVLSASALAGVLSLLTSVAGLPELKGGNEE